MADPIIEQIVDYIVTALETITTDNGYGIQIGSGGVYRPIHPDAYGKSGYTQPNWVQLVEGDPVKSDTFIPGPQPLIEWVQPILLDLIYQPDSEATTPIGQNLALFYAEVSKAFYSDPDNPPSGYTIPANNSFNQWNSLVVNTDDGDPEGFIDRDNGYVAFNRILTVRYRHKENDPTTQ